MKKILQVYHELRDKVTFLYYKLKLFKYKNTTGRTLSLPIIETVTLSLYKQTQNIATKKAIWKDFQPPCSYKTLVVNMNRCALLALVILMRILRENRDNSHLVKHTDSTDIPVCLPKNAKHHRTMYGLAEWGYSGKGFFYGIKLHLTSDLKRKILSFRFSSGNVHGTKVFAQLNKDLDGIFVADAEFVSEDLQREFYREHRRILFAQPRKNMKKIITAFQKKLYDTRMLIELNFRNLKMFFGLVTSLPRSVGGYLGNYLYSILAYALR
jgi:DDE family transposase